MSEVKRFNVYRDGVTINGAVTHYGNYKPSEKRETNPNVRKVKK